MVWSCFPFIRFGQNHLAGHSKRGKKTRRTKEEVGRQHQGMDRPGVRQVPEGSGEPGKMEKTGCKIICGAPTTLAVKGLMMIMMMVHLITDNIALMTVQLGFAQTQIVRECSLVILKLCTNRELHVPERKTNLAATEFTFWENAVWFLKGK